MEIFFKRGEWNGETCHSKRLNKDLTRTFTTTKGIIKKEKKTVEALKGISFDINKGETIKLMGGE